MPMSPAARKRLLGTSASTRAPWEKEVWEKEMDPFAGCPAHLRDSVSDYAMRRHVKTSQQNLEELCRQQELSRNMVAEYKFENQDEIAGEGPERVGRVMHCLDFLDKLNTIIPAYLSARIDKGLCGLAVNKPCQDPTDPQKRIEWQYVCACQVGFMHEYSTVYVDKRGLPLNEKWRGWRTVVLRLILKGFITEQQADQVFGLATGPAARRYREQLFEFRNRGEKA
jgi:hypothetical protein